MGRNGEDSNAARNKYAKVVVRGGGKKLTLEAKEQSTSSRRSCAIIKYHMRMMYPALELQDFSRGPMRFLNKGNSMPGTQGFKGRKVSGSCNPRSQNL